MISINSTQDTLKYAKDVSEMIKHVNRKIQNGKLSKKPYYETSINYYNNIINFYKTQPTSPMIEDLLNTMYDGINTFLLTNTTLEVALKIAGGTEIIKMITNIAKTSVIVKTNKPDIANAVEEEINFSIDAALKANKEYIKKKSLDSLLVANTIVNMISALLPIKNQQSSKLENKSFNMEQTSEQSFIKLSPNKMKQSLEQSSEQRSDYPYPIMIASFNTKI